MELACVEDLQRYLRLPGVEDAVPRPPKEKASRTARTSVTATRWRG